MYKYQNIVCKPERYQNLGEWKHEAASKIAKVNLSEMVHVYKMMYKY